jgi:lipopolysaccharide export system permease protein
MSGRSFELAEDNWAAKRMQLAHAEVQLQRFYTEPHRRWANGFSCLCFVMIGAPMAMWRKHGEFWGSFFMCFAPILLIYYPMLVGSLDLAKRGVVPAPAVWLGNLVLVGIGVWLMRRIVRF